MLYLIDANVPITAHNSYYPLSVVPEFWEWMEHVAADGQAKMPPETFGELKGGNPDKDALLAWAKQPNIVSALRLQEEAAPEFVRQVLDCYGENLTDDELETIGQDPFLIAYCLADPENRAVVTTEVSARKKKRQNRKVPDVCADLGVRCYDPFQFLRTLKFSTGWNKHRPQIAVPAAA